MELNKKNELRRIAAAIRMGALSAVYQAGSGHPGGSLSIADILAYLYFAEMRIDPQNPKWPDRDRFVLSKGHCSPALYATLAERGFFPRNMLNNFRQADSILQGHPDMKHIPGVDMSTGSLGLGVSAACGMALSAKINKKDYRVYAVMGDGESEEGQIWEAAMFAAHYRLDNLCVFLDFNGLQIDGPIDEVISPAPFENKFTSFGWNVVSIDAHDFDAIEGAIEKSKSVRHRPTLVVAKSIKGKGVSYMENNVKWHGAAPDLEQFERGLSDIRATVADIR